MEKYLIELLETNNRVIVPDLGAFIIRQQEPRELVFNDLLAFNDGMLTTHIKQQEGISMSKAQVKIEEFVDLVKKVLTKGDIYHLENLGYLKMDDSSKIEFSVTKFPTVRAEVVSAATLSQYMDLEESHEQPEKDTTEEVPEQAEEEVADEQAPASEEPMEQATEDKTPEVETPEEELPEEELPEEEIREEETPEEELPEEELPEEAFSEEETPEEEFSLDEAKVPSVAEWELDEKEAERAEMAAEETPESATDDGSFTLEDQAAEIEVDASEDTPLIPEAEEPPFLIEEQYKQEEEKKMTVVGTSRARLEAAAAAATDDEKNEPLKYEKAPLSTSETSIPYYVGRETSTRRIWPWIGGAAALIIILLVAAWFFFPDEVNRILAGKPAEIETTEEAVSDASALQGSTSGDEGQTADETAQDQVEITGETVTPGGETANDATVETEAGLTDSESVEEPETEPETEPAPPPAGQSRKYYIVAGMFSSRANAEAYVATLKAKGYDAELFGRKNNLYAVSFSSHVSKEAAVREMNRIREQFNPDAWLLYY